MAVATLGFCQGQQKTANTQNLQELCVVIGSVVTQDRILIYVLITQKSKREGSLSLYVR
jgi:hypothetical protein